MPSLAPVLTPHGALILAPADDGAPIDEKLAARLQKVFDEGSGHGLLFLGADQVGAALPATLSYWREFGARYVTALCALPGLGENAAKPPLEVPADAELEKLAAGAPPMTGAEYLTPSVLAELWRAIDTAFDAERGAAKLPIQHFLRTRNPAWNLVGRVHFNLAENRKDEDAPFAFLATYTTRLSAAAKAQHLPLGKALQEYSGARHRERLLSLLMPVQRAAEQCSWLKPMIESGEIYHPLRWTPQQALLLLKDASLLEGAGVVVRMPASWRMNRPARPQVTASVGAKAPSRLGLDALLDFRMEVTLEGETLSRAEIKKLLAQTEGLAFIRGKWVEVDHERLARTLEQFEAAERHASTEGLSFAEAMRMLSGAGLAADEPGSRTDADWGRTVAGPWLAETLASLRQPDGKLSIDPGAALRGTLRPYQRAGLNWLYLLTRLRLGACLADDMGLGKTIQVLALLLVLRQEAAAGKPSLLVAPASLLANWAGEIARFAPELRAIIIHPSAMPPDQVKSAGAHTLADIDLAITSYGYLARAPWLSAADWRLAVLDEAQAIKNPTAKQTRTVKQLRADVRLALTGTPIENRLGDLWSIFDFINPGLLGSSKQFSAFVKGLGESPRNSYGPLRELVRPYILRRLKTDKTIIADLPDKTELKTFCSLTRKQAALYQEAVEELAAGLQDADGMQRKGIVLAFLMRFKQICNHPSQWLATAPGPRTTAASSLDCASSPRPRPRGRRRRWCSPSSVRPRRRLQNSSARCSDGPGWCCTARRQFAIVAPWCSASRRMRRYRSSSCH